jgi:hypothetical protein
MVSLCQDGRGGRREGVRGREEGRRRGGLELIIVT